LAEVRVDFKEPRYIGEVLLALAGRPGGIENGPDFPLKNIFKAGDRQAKPKDVAHGGPGQKCLIPRVSLNLDPQVGTDGGDINAMSESFNLEILLQQLLNLRELVHGNNNVEIEADNRFCVGVDALSAEHAITNPALVQQLDHSAKKIRLISHHNFPERLCPHSSTRS
jgi:hypothetical protein